MSQKQKQWQFNAKLGDEKFSILTDDVADQIMKMCEEESDINVIMDKIEKLITKCKFRAYGLKMLNFKHLETFQISEVWKYWLKELERMSELVEEESETNKIFKTKTNIDN